MNLQALPGVGLVAVFVAGGVLYLLALLWVISRFSGWARLGQRFGTTEEFRGEAWNWQSARFRGWCSYNNCLKVGCEPGGTFFCSDAGDVSAALLSSIAADSVAGN